MGEVTSLPFITISDGGVMTRATGPGAAGLDATGDDLIARFLPEVFRAVVAPFSSLSEESESDEPVSLEDESDDEEEASKH